LLRKLSGVIPNCSTVTVEKFKGVLNTFGVQRLGVPSGPSFWGVTSFPVPKMKEAFSEMDNILQELNIMVQTNT
jgi:hypothetical protein